jgi:inner membrane protein
LFNSTHTLVGILVAQTGIGRRLPHAVLGAAIAANLPDIDIVMGLPGSPSYFEHHRGITHSLAGVAVLVPIFGWLLSRWTGDFRRTLLLIGVAMLTHPLLDYANTYGIQPFLPFNSTRYYGDTLFVVDPYLDALLLAAVLAAAFWRNSQYPALVGIAATRLYAGVRVEMRDAARARLTARAAAEPETTAAAVIPQMLAPLEFSGILETPDAYRIVSLSLRTAGATTPADADDPPEAVLAKLASVQSDAVRRAVETRTGRVFRHFARHPAVRVEETAEGLRILLLDARFFNRGGGRGFAAEIVLDRALRVIGEDMGFGLRQ